MRSDTDYSDPLHGRAALPDVIARFEERVLADNPITTVEVGPSHFEYRTYPEIALREALLNAFAHRDYQIGGPVVVKQYGHGLDVHSPGGFIGGVSPANVLHHQPVARNPHLVDALIRLRLVNRGNLGVPRMFTAMLQDGREPPVISEMGDAVTVAFRAGTFSRAFRTFVAEQDALGRRITVDHLLILHWLLRHPELPLDEAAQLVQRPEGVTREILNELEIQWGVLERGGAGRGMYWTLDPVVHAQLAAPGLPERNRRIDAEAAKTRLLSVLRHRARRGEPGLTNAQARAITHFGRERIKRLMDELRREGVVQVEGTRKNARWVCVESAIRGNPAR
jgi:ATP-dependent DNA helicase RecG